jgi:vitamin K-dependent gamma-carboxylase
VAYFFAGIAKISPDWLRGEPMRACVARGTNRPILGRISHQEWVVYVGSYGALLFDLLIVPLLLWRRTRVAAFCVAVGFHLLNAQLFSIGVFPWLAIAATALFFPPDWPRRIVSIFRPTTAGSAVDQRDKLPSPRKQRLVLTLVTVYVAIQIFIPLRHFLYPGGIEWMYLEHRFSWQMMLRLQSAREYFYVTDPNVGRTVQVSPREYLSQRQILRMAWRPDMILQFARYLTTVMPRAGPEPLKVEARILVSLNGRKPQRFLDPNVDLAAELWTWGRPRWLLQVHEPLPPSPPRGREVSGNALAPTFDDN